MMLFGICLMGIGMVFIVCGIIREAFKDPSCDLPEVEQVPLDDYWRP